MKTEPQKSGDVAQVEASAIAHGEAADAKRSFGSWHVLRDRNYALLFWGQLISSGGTQMQVVAVAWQVYLLTHSAIALGVIGLMQAIPRLIFSLVGGVLADVLDRRKMLMIVNLSMMSFSAILALCTSFQIMNIAIMYVVISHTPGHYSYPGSA